MKMRSNLKSSVCKIDFGSKVEPVIVNVYDSEIKWGLHILFKRKRMVSMIPIASLARAQHDLIYMKA